MAISIFAKEVAAELKSDKVRLLKIIDRFNVIRSTHGLTADEHDAVSEAADNLEIILSWAQS